MIPEQDEIQQAASFGDGEGIVKHSHLSFLDNCLHLEGHSSQVCCSSCVWTVVQMIWRMSLELNYCLKPFLNPLRQGAMKIQSAINWLIRYYRMP